jgi:hypothetical protein
MVMLFHNLAVQSKVRKLSADELNAIFALPKTANRMVHAHQLTFLTK